MNSDFKRGLRDDTGDDLEERDRQSIVEFVESARLDDYLDQIEGFLREHPEARRVTVKVVKRIGVPPIALLPLEAREALAPERTGVLQPRVVGLLPGTVLRQAIHHPEVTAADYRRAPDLIWNGAIELRGDGTELAFYREYDGVWFRAIVRYAGGGPELTSLHPIGHDLLPDAVRASRLLDLDDQDDFDDPEVRESLEAASRLPGVVSLSARTMQKQHARHPELTIEEYRLLPDLIEHGEVEAPPDGQKLVIFGEFHGRRYRAVVTQTSAGRLYLTCFHRVSRRPRRRSTPPSRCGKGAGE